MTHLWWLSDRTPEIDPYSPDQSKLDFHRARVLEAADFVVPGPRRAVPRRAVGFSRRRTAGR